MTKLTAILVALLVISAIFWWRRPEAPAPRAAVPCQDQFIGGLAPRLVNPKLGTATFPLCFSAYASLFSGVTRTPLYSAEHLTAGRIVAARLLVRVNSFHPEPLLPAGVRSELADYRGSGYDRGHMAPNADMPDPQAQAESFSLANMVPQDHDNNAGIWAEIEGTVREATVSDGEAYIVTGPLFGGTEIEVINGRVSVPTGIWKAVYNPLSREAGAYVTDNRPGQDYEMVSIDDLERLSGIDPFPALPGSIKTAKPDLPTLRPNQSRAAREAH